MLLETTTSSTPFSINWLWHLNVPLTPDALQVLPLQNVNSAWYQVHKLTLQYLTNVNMLQKALLVYRLLVEHANKKKKSLIFIYRSNPMKIF